MKKRSTGSSAAQSAWCSIYPATILALWARYHAKAASRIVPDRRHHAEGLCRRVTGAGQIA
jgi:hypothetical protein